MVKTVPDRWLDYKAIGDVVAGSSFVAFKVPLHNHICQRLSSPERHTTSDVFQALPRLGIVINLTNTQNDSKYYQPHDWERHGVDYKWIRTEGHVTPSKSLLINFCRTVKKFLMTNPGKLVGVHCTHGLNRTGYFVCSYMVLCNNVSPSDAIRNFGAARGHEIERANYIQDIMCHSTNDSLKAAVRMSERPPSVEARNDLLPTKIYHCPPGRQDELPRTTGRIHDRRPLSGRFNKHPPRRYNEHPPSSEGFNEQPSSSWRSNDRPRTYNERPPSSEGFNEQPSSSWRSNVRPETYNEPPPSSGISRNPRSFNRPPERPDERPLMSRRFHERPPPLERRERSPPSRTFNERTQNSFADPAPPGTSEKRSKNRWSRWDRQQRDEKANRGRKAPSFNDRE